MELTDNARQVLERRYLLRDASGQVTESPEEMFRRVARDIASAETNWGGEPDRWEELFHAEMTSLRFLPNSPTLMNAGRDLQQLAACFVLPLDDSLESIFETLKLTALIHQSGGGTGFSFSRLRPRGSRVKTTGGVASGPVSFLEVYDAATERIKQGSFRRGANMGILSVTHPDILEFIDCKRDGGVTNFNISVGVTGDWMQRVRDNAEYDLVNPHDGKTVATVSAGEVFERLVASAWETGDPGLVFLDRLNRPRTNPTPSLGAIEATNPCGEQPLLPFEACVLGSIAVSRFVEESAIQWDALRGTVQIAVRFLDDAVERSSYPLAEIARMHRDGNRKIGLGIMGWADLLCRLEIPYDSEEALKLAEELMSRIRTAADAASEELAAERGPFPNWEQSLYGPGGENRPMRNATRTTIAPTGTLSIIASCSSGIEPLFALSYSRRALDGVVLQVTHSDFQQQATAAGIWSESLAQQVATDGSIRDREDLPERMRQVFVTAHDLDYPWHVRHQAAFQAHVDAAVSKTVNLPREATPSDVRAAYLLADELGCSGITVYRDGSKRWQVLARGHLTGTDSGTVEGSPPLPEEDKLTVPPSRGQNVLEVCPVCGNASFEFAETCGKCHSCGHSIC